MAQATYKDENFSVTFDARMEECDYGVDRSPVWHEPTDITIASFEFLGFDMPIEHIPDNVYDALIEYADEIDGDDWE